MKKTLFMCALGLTVATSMVAGTMAIYTHTDSLLGENGTATATAKNFYIKADATETSVINMKFAPGEHAEWDFNVTNALANNPSYFSEVDTDLVVTLSAEEEINWEDFTIQLFRGNDDVKTAKPLATGLQDGKSVSFTLSGEFLANTQVTKGYKLQFIWVDPGTDAKNEMQTNLVYPENGELKVLPTAKNFKVTVTGKQSTNNDAWTSTDANEDWTGYPKN